MLQISCDALSRLIPVALHENADKIPEMYNVRFEDGLAIVTTSEIMVVENIGGFAGVYYLKPDSYMLETMTNEACLGGTATIMPDMMITTYGYYNQPMVPVTPSKFDNWRDVIERAKEPLAGPTEFGTCWSVTQLKLLTSASPSKAIVLEPFSDPTVKPVMIRDLYDDNWFAIARPYNPINPTATATYPKWL
jgi:hypothetical protein